ncbi:MAG: SDR family NAD(P)-dependent oxidoreductase [Saprospiraceae bacterium]|nr:SDR family NAD(P)-dependent oxidoreductase [Saprospiraceae bacterium]
MTKDIVFITGVSSGIGYHTCKTLIKNDYSVVGSVRSEEDKARLLKEMGSDFHCLVFDVTDYKAIDKAMEELDQLLKGRSIRYLINNAGIAVPGPLEFIDDEDFQNQIQVNLIAVRYITNSILKRMPKNEIQNKAKIIFISSVSGIFAAPFNGAYCISKHALECMIDIYRRELMIYDIDCISIQPGPIKTRIWSKTMGKFEPFKQTVYANIANKADKILEHSEKHALPVERVTNRILKILNLKRPKTRYIVHTNSFGLKLLANWLPDRFVDRLIWNNLNKADSNTYRPV